MRQFDTLCPPLVREFSAADIRRLRESLQFSQPVFALHLHTTASTVRKWEHGESLHRSLPPAEWEALTQHRASLPSWMAEAIGREVARGVSGIVIGQSGSVTEERQSRSWDSDLDILVEAIVKVHGLTCMLQHRASEILWQTVNVPAHLDVAGQQGQECADGDVFGVGIGTVDDDIVRDRHVGSPVTSARVAPVGQRV